MDRGKDHSDRSPDKETADQLAMKRALQSSLTLSGNRELDVAAASVFLMWAVRLPLSECCWPSAPNFLEKFDFNGSICCQVSYSVLPARYEIHRLLMKKGT